MDGSRYISNSHKPSTKAVNQRTANPTSLVSKDLPTQKPLVASANDPEDWRQNDDKVQLKKIVVPRQKHKSFDSAVAPECGLPGPGYHRSRSPAFRASAQQLVQIAPPVGLGDLFSGGTTRVSTFEERLAGGQDDGKARDRGLGSGHARACASVSLARRPPIGYPSRALTARKLPRGALR